VSKFFFLKSCFSFFFFFSRIIVVPI
jgi:hypothetical protein